MRDAASTKKKAITRNLHGEARLIVFVRRAPSIWLAFGSALVVRRGLRRVRFRNGSLPGLVKQKSMERRAAIGAKTRPPNLYAKQQKKCSSTCRGVGRMAYGADLPGYPTVHLPGCVVA